MNSGNFEPFVSYADDKPSRLILFPFTSFESFCSDEWIGRESEWFSIFSLLHATLSYFNYEPSTRILLIQPYSPYLEENLALHVDERQILTISVDSESNVFDELRSAIENRPIGELDLILATAIFSTGATTSEENGLLRAFHRALKNGGALLATFPLQDQLGNALTARNIQFLDVLASAGFEQDEISGCDGITHYLDPAFWGKLRKQGHANFDAVLNAFSQMSDSPSTLWMSKTALYSGFKR